MKKPMANLFSDERFRALTAAFFEGADDSKVVDDGGDTEQQLSLRVGPGVTIAYGEDLSLKLFACLDLLSNAMEAQHFNREDVEGMLWEIAETSDATKDKQRRLADDILKNSRIGYVQYLPCSVIRLPATPDCGLDFGPLQVRRTAEVDADLAAEKRAVRLEVGEHPAPPEHRGGEYYLKFSAACWQIRISASRGNLREEATWLAGVVASFVRLHLMIRGEPVRFAPSVGRLEVEPATPVSVWLPGVTVYERSSSAGGFEIPGLYELDEGSLSYLNARRDQASQILQAAEGTVGLRVAQGLGWMAKGRQTRDQAGRLLHFFTALEALLSTTSANDPVTQTISRLSSVILQRDPTKRSPIAKELRSLYAQRSSVVHRGSRAVTDMSSRKVQHYVEQVYCAVLDQQDLTVAHQVFLSELEEASFGQRWPTTNSVE